MFPDAIIKRLAGVPKEKQAEEGINICLEQIEELRQEEGIRGFHIMAIEWEEKVPEIVSRAGSIRGRKWTELPLISFLTGCIPNRFRRCGNGK